MEQNLFNQIQTRIIVKEKLSLINAAIMTANVLNRFADETKDAVIRWSKGEDVTDFSYQGTTVSAIIHQLQCSEFQAVCILDEVGVNRNSFATALLREKEYGRLR